MKSKYIWLIIILTALYAFFVFSFNLTIEYYSEIIVASVFFFALFSSFFIQRQNTRYSNISTLVAERDGLFSYLYRVSGLVPRIQKEVKEIIKAHYGKIAESGDWSYHESNPSDTLTRLTETFGTLTNEEMSQAKVTTTYEVIWDTIRSLQQARKKIILLKKERLLFFQWVLVWALGLILVASFNFISTDVLLVEVIKVIFGVCVFITIALLKQLDDLSIFSSDFSRETARDALRIIEEADREELGRA